MFIYVYNCILSYPYICTMRINTSSKKKRIYDDIRELVCVGVILAN